MEVIIGKAAQLLYPFFGEFVGGDFTSENPAYDPFIAALFDDTVMVFAYEQIVYVFYFDIAKYYFADRWDELSEEQYERAEIESLIILSDEEIDEIPQEWFDDPNEHYEEWEQFTKELWLKSLSEEARAMFETAQLFHKIKEEAVA